MPVPALVRPLHVPGSTANSKTKQPTAIVAPGPGGLRLGTQRLPTHRLLPAAPFAKPTQDRGGIPWGRLSGQCPRCAVWYTGGTSWYGSFGVSAGGRIGTRRRLLLYGTHNDNYRPVELQISTTIVDTSTGNLGTVFSNTLNIPTRQTITDRGIGVIPLSLTVLADAPQKIANVHDYVNIDVMPEQLQGRENSSRVSFLALPTA